MTSKIVVNNIEADAGISTVTFASEVTAPTFNGNIVGTSATFSGNVNVAGVLTYEDVTSVDAVGLSTFQNGIHVTGGLVGIGTDNPARKVEIFDTAATVLQLNSTSTDGTSLRIQNSKTDKMYMGLAGDFITGQVNNVTDSAIRSNGSLLFASGGGTERLRITSSGNIGIGTTNPAHKLDVLSSAFPTARLSSTYTSSSKEYNSLYFGVGNVNQTTQIGHVYDTVTAANSFFHITPYGQGEGETFSVLTNRNIGIGLTNPSAKLHIKTPSGTDTPGSTSSHLLFDLADDSGPGWVQRVWDSGAGTLGLDGSFAIDRRYSGVWTNAITIKRSDGNIGIGTDNPSTKLEVATSVDGEATLATFKNTSAGGTNETVDINLGLEGNTTSSNVILRAGKEANHGSGAATDNFFAIHTTLNNTSSEKLRIDSDGRVTKPYQLWIAGSPTNTGGSGTFNSFSTAIFADPVGLSFDTDRITVPIAGVYMITFNTICDSSSTRQDTVIMVNGSTISSQLSENSTAGYHYRSASLAVKLAASDYIQFHSQDWYDAATASTTWRTASVYLLG